MQHYTRDELEQFLTDRGGPEYATAALDLIVNRWGARGDGAAVYENHDLGHPQVGDIQVVSYGSPTAQLETDEPPTTLPDIGGAINWRYQLIGTYRSR